MRDLNDRPLGCDNPERVSCPGIYEKQYKTPPTLHSSCTPTRVRDDGISYREKSSEGTT